LRALEETAGLPPAVGGDRNWLEQLVVRINDTKGTDLKYQNENYGYVFEYAPPESAMLLGEIKQKPNL
jgi:hypothetical protein